jgi:hypothetical protein
MRACVFTEGESAFNFELLTFNFVLRVLNRSMPGR